MSHAIELICAFRACAVRMLCHAEHAASTQTNWMCTGTCVADVVANARTKCAAIQRTKWPIDLVKKTYPLSAGIVRWYTTKRHCNWFDLSIFGCCSAAPRTLSIIVWNRECRLLRSKWFELRFVQQNCMLCVCVCRRLSWPRPSNCTNLPLRCATNTWSLLPLPNQLFLKIERKWKKCVSFCGWN